MDLHDQALPVQRGKLGVWDNREVLTEPATSASVPVLWVAQVARAPDVVALSCVGRSMTYREVEQAANRLAHLLTAHGAGPGGCVAVLFSRCAEAVVAILAVLKTGAAYLPIDPAVPPARLEFMVGDAAPIAVITTADLAERFAGLGLQVIDVADPAIDHHPDTALDAAGPRRYRPHHLHLGNHRCARGGGGHPSQRHPVVRRSRCRFRAGQPSVDAVSLLRLRLLGLGDLGCAAARWTTGGGAGTGGPVTDRLPRPADRRTGQRLESNPLRGGDVIPTRPRSPCGAGARR